MAVLTFDDLNQIAKPRYLLRPLIELGTSSMIFGPSGGGKSFIAIDLALSVATGRPWAGMATNQYPIVYVSAEGSSGLGRRIRAWYLEAIEQCQSDEERQEMIHSLTANVCAISHPVEVADAAHRAALIQTVREVFGQRQIGLVVLDTVARNAIGLEENSAKEMGLFVAGCDQLRMALGVPLDPDEETDDHGEPTMLLIHHTGVQMAGQDTELRERGSSALRAAMEVSFAVDPKADGCRILTKKVKDGKVPEPMAVTWSDQIQVGYDWDLGEPITSIVARVSAPGTATSPAEDRAEKKRAELAKLDRAIMEEMEKAPDLTIREIALNLDESRSKVGRRVKWMQDQGKVTRRDRRYVTSLPEFVPVDFGIGTNSGTAD